MNRSTYRYDLPALRLESAFPIADYTVFASSRPAEARPVVRLTIANERPPRGETLVRNDILTVERLSDGWLFTGEGQREACAVRVSRDYTQMTAYTDGDEAAFRSLLPMRLQTALECAAIAQNAISLHSACVSVNGEAAAFTAPSGTGKSTRAFSWIKALGAELISGDRPELLLRNDGMLACGVPWDGKEAHFSNVRVPIRVIAEIRRAPFTAARELTCAQKTELLLSQCFIPMWDTNTAAHAIMLIRQYVRRLRVVRLFCGPDEQAAREAYELLWNHPEEIREAAADMRIKKGFELHNIIGEYIVMPDGDNFDKFKGTVVLNEISAFIFEQLKKPIAYEDLLDMILREYDVDKARAKSDLDALLARFREYGLMEEEKR